ncbi:MAG TPA: hypothetical protein VJX10_15315, partial [Pseudonocardiaceae bacterium]|nr:hypothetical protein [Pseudonocardiaceae bacterium]
RHGGPELVLDARDRAALRRELAGHGLPAGDRAPFRVPLAGRSAQSVMRVLAADLTRCQVVEPTLEDTYLRLLDRAGR